MNYKEKTYRVFNKFFSSFLKDLKEVDDDLRKLVKASYKAVDKSSDVYCKAFVEGVFVGEGAVSKIAAGNLDGLEGCSMATGITVGTVMEHVGREGKEEERKIIMSYLYTLALFAYMYTMDNEDDVFAQVVRVLGHVQGGDEEKYDAEKEDILDDDIKGLLERIRGCGVKPRVEVGVDTGASAEDLMAGFGGGKIASLAKEIAKDIDVSSLKSDNPDEMIKNMLDFSSGNNVLGKIIQQVSSTLNNKITSGEIKHDELLGEAMSMMNIFGGGGGGGAGGAANPLAGLASNPLFSQMMSAMKTGKAQVRQDVVKKQDTRERLRKKLEARKSAE